jgi:hypothetical protein
MRSLIAGGLALGMVLGAGCNPPTCGKGTKQVQAVNGDVQCVPVDGVISDIDCDVDAGATLVAGKCVSAITCGANTKLVNGECVGTGGMGMAHTPDPCNTPGSGKICVNGVVRNLKDNSFLDGTQTVRVWVVDPLKFLAAPGALISTPCPGAQNPCLAPPASTKDTYTFNDLPTPAAGLIGLAVGDDAGVSPQVLQITGTGAKVTSGQKYQVDGYATPLALVQSWDAQVPGKNYATIGAYVARFFLDAAPAPNMLTATESMPASGVTLLQDGSNSGAKYFDPDFTTIGSGTSTSAFGAALLPGSGDSQIFTFSGMGNTPGAKWEAHPGNTTMGVVFVDRYHPCMQDAMGNCVTM